MNSFDLPLTVEQLGTSELLALFHLLTTKMQTYQTGVGEQPSIDEFVQWRNAADTVVAVGRLIAGDQAE